MSILDTYVRLDEPDEQPDEENAPVRRGELCVVCQINLTTDTFRKQPVEAGCQYSAYTNVIAFSGAKVGADNVVRWERGGIVPAAETVNLWNRLGLIDDKVAAASRVARDVQLHAA